MLAARLDDERAKGGPRLYTAQRPSSVTAQQPCRRRRQSKLDLSSSPTPKAGRSARVPYDKRQVADAVDDEGETQTLGMVTSPARPPHRKLSLLDVSYTRTSSDPRPAGALIVTQWSGAGCRAAPRASEPEGPARQRLWQGVRRQRQRSTRPSGS
ncbi:hypothetical protein CDD83_1099 [Cordyceps sp. RAO-2017]|nr:hypothetical protein CDD83_1099 [Cordyceps sp. RAO-2017]